MSEHNGFWIHYCELSGTTEYFESPRSESDQHVYTSEEYGQLKAEVERLRLQLAGCGVIAMANTRRSAKDCRNISPDLMCASISDVARAVDREMDLRDEVERLKAREAKWRELVELLYVDGHGFEIPNTEKHDRMRKLRSELVEQGGEG